MDQAVWNTISSIIDAETDTATRYEFQYGDWRMRIGPPPLTDTNIGFQFADCSWPDPAPSRERVKKELAQNAFKDWIPNRPPLFRPIALDAFSFWLPLHQTACTSVDNFLDVYKSSIDFLACLGGTQTNAFAQQVDHNLHEFSPQVSAGEDSCKGRLSSSILGYTAHFSTLRHLKHRHDVHAEFALAPGCPSFEFESSQFPLKHFDLIKVGNKLCDKAFFFKTKSDRRILKALVPPLNSLATLEGRFHVRCLDGVLSLEGKYCDTLSAIPAIAACAEIWRCLLSHSAGVEFTARPSPIYCAIPHEQAV